MGDHNKKTRSVTLLQWQSNHIIGIWVPTSYEQNQLIESLNPFEGPAQVNSSFTKPNPLR